MYMKIFQDFELLLSGENNINLTNPHYILRDGGVFMLVSVYWGIIPWRKPNLIRIVCLSFFIYRTDCCVPCFPYHSISLYKGMILCLRTKYAIL